MALTKIPAGLIGADAVTATEIAADAVSTSEIAANAVGNSEMADNAIGNAEMADNAVGSAEITDASVARADLAADARRDYLEYRDEKAANTAGGTATSGSFETRTLNVEAADAGGHGSLSSNQITLAAGTYEADILVPGAGGVNAFIAKLRNTSDSSDTLVGTTAIAGGGNIMAHSHITGRFTIAAQKTFEVQMRVGTTVATNGWGFPSNLGVGETYTIARFWKVG